MANLQPVYGEYLAPAIAGMRANMEPARVISRINGSGLTVGMGVAVTRGSTDMTVQTPVQGSALAVSTSLPTRLRAARSF
jgi:hypothetical protein